MTDAGLVPGFIAAIQTFGVRIDFNYSITINIKGKSERGKKEKRWRLIINIAKRILIHPLIEKSDF